MGQISVDYADLGHISLFVCAQKMLIYGTGYDTDQSCFILPINIDLWY